VDRPTFEQTRRIIVPGEPPPDAVPVERQGTVWDKEAPKGPPTPEVRRVPEWFEDVYHWMQGAVNDEGLLIDLCLERAVEIVRFNHDRGMVGIDLFQEGGENGGGAATRAHFLAIASPLAVELYKQTLVTIDKNKAELTKLVEAALAKKAASEGKKAAPVLSDSRGGLPEGFVRV
jgi:hypothetical protein